MVLTQLQKLQISAKHRQEWYRTLAHITNDGLPIFDALERMAREFAKTGHPMTPLIQALLLRLRGAGQSVAGTQRRTIGSELMSMVPRGEAMLIQAGEQSGNMSAGFSNAAELLESKGALKSSVINAMVKPAGYLIGLTILLLYFSIKLLPSFEKTRPRAQWPESAQMLGAVADHAWLIASGLCGFLVLGGLAIAFIVPRWDGELRETFDRSVFPFNLIASLHGAALLTTLSGYISAGVPFAEAVQNIRLTASPYMKMQCGKLLNMMKSGKRPDEALTGLSIIHPKFRWIISVYGMSGNSAAAYETISKEITRSVQAFINMLFGTVINNALLITMGFMLFWIYSSMFGIAGAGQKF